MHVTPLPDRQRLAAIQSLASPIRQEVISELGEGPATVKELAGRLGRSRQALHFHVGVLEKAGLVEAASTRGEGRAAERVYRRVRGTTDLRARERLSPRERAAATGAARALLRLTQREVAAAIARPDLGRKGPPTFAIRAKARLDAAAIARLQELIKEATTLFRVAKGKNQGQGLLAMTIVLTPAREAVSKRQTRTEVPP